MWEYGFPLDRILPYKDEIKDSTLIQENTGHWKPVLRMFYVVYIHLATEHFSGHVHKRKCDFLMLE